MTAGALRVFHAAESAARRSMSFPGKFQAPIFPCRSSEGLAEAAAPTDTDLPEAVVIPHEHVGPSPWRMAIIFATGQGAQAVMLCTPM